jgi:hypothetical protein
MKTAILIAALSAVIAFAVEFDSPRAEQKILPAQTVVCDSEGFLKAAQDAESTRLSRRIDEATFARMAGEPKTIVLDARSSDHWKQLRVRGSVSLPYTDFSASALERIIPSRDTRVLIYCRNNIKDTRPVKPLPVQPQRSLSYPDEFDPPQIPKAFAAGLNIPTFITLHIYGYANVYELSTAVDPNASPIQFDSTIVP